MPALAVPGASLNYTTYPPTTTTSSSSSTLSDSTFDSTLDPDPVSDSNWNSTSNWDSNPMTSRPPPPPHHFLLIPGALGIASAFDLLVAVLTARGFWVTTYTRRGYIGSPLVPTEAYDGDDEGEEGEDSGRGESKLRRKRDGEEVSNVGLEKDAHDVAALLRHLVSTPTSTATPTSTSTTSIITAHKISILATSNGALITLALLSRYPTLITQLHRILIHEPPLLTVFVPQRREVMKRRFESIYDVFRIQGPEVAVRKLVSGLTDRWEREVGGLRVMGLLPTNPAGLVQDENRRPTNNSTTATRANLTHYLIHELRQYPSHSSLTPFTLSTIPEAAREKAILLAGELSYNDTGYPSTLGAVAAPAIAELWGRRVGGWGDEHGQQVVRVPGGSLGWANENFVGWLGGVLGGLVSDIGDSWGNGEGNW